MCVLSAAYIQSVSIVLRAEDWQTQSYTVLGHHPFLSSFNLRKSLSPKISFHLPSFNLRKSKGLHFEKQDKVTGAQYQNICQKNGAEVLKTRIHCPPNQIVRVLGVIYKVLKVLLNFWKMW